MKFEKEYLIDLVNGKSCDFPPFSSGKWKTSDGFLKQVVGRMTDIKTIILTPDFDHYGSGYSSYVHIYLSKKDCSDLRITETGDLRTEEVDGLMIYLCRLAPHAVYGQGTWTKTYKNGKWQSGSSHYIHPEEIGTTPSTNWNAELIEIGNILNQFGITFLTKEELNVKLDFKVSIPTILGDPPFKVFDCFFYWED